MSTTKVRYTTASGRHSSIELDTADLRKLERAAAEMTLLVRERDAASAALQAAEEKLVQRWEELTGVPAGDRWGADEASRARAGYLRSMMNRFDASGAVACRHEGRIVVVPGREQ